jgi:hypothetical protein
MLFRTNAVNSEHHVEHTGTLCGKEQRFLTLVEVVQYSNHSAFDGEYHKRVWTGVALEKDPLLGFQDEYYPEGFLL